MDKKTELAIDLGQVIYTNTINSLTQQRDELLGVLQIARNGLVQWHVPDNRYAALTAIDAVLAKVGAGDTAVQGDMLLPANAELRGAKPIGEASLSNDVLGADAPERN